MWAGFAKAAFWASFGKTWPTWLFTWILDIYRFAGSRFTGPDIGYWILVSGFKFYSDSWILSPDSLFLWLLAKHVLLIHFTVIIQESRMLSVWSKSPVCRLTSGPLLMRDCPAAETEYFQGKADCLPDGIRPVLHPWAAMLTTPYSLLQPSRNFHMDR